MTTMTTMATLTKEERYLHHIEHDRLYTLAVDFERKGYLRKEREAYKLFNLVDSVLVSDCADEIYE